MKAWLCLVAVLCITRTENAQGQIFIGDIDYDINLDTCHPQNIASVDPPAPDECFTPYDTRCLQPPSGDRVDCKVCKDPNNATLMCPNDTNCEDWTASGLSCPINSSCYHNEITGYIGCCVSDCDSRTGGGGSGEGGPGDSTEEEESEETDGHHERYEYDPYSYLGDHQQWDPNSNIAVQVYYDANQADPNDPFMNATFNTNVGTSVPIACDNEGIVCDETSPYRTMDGTCNNLINPIWAASNTAYMRYLDPVFEVDTDPVDNVPREDGLPGARAVSNALFSSEHNQHFGKKHSLSLIWFGQFLAHDLALTTQHEEPENCCNETFHDDPNCLPIPVPSYDRFYYDHCLHFTRSLLAERGCLPAFPPFPPLSLQNYGEVENHATGYLDLSHVYGTTPNASDALRNFTGGKLKTKEGHNGMELLPENHEKECPMQNPHAYCQLTGDKRVDDINYLGANHLAFVRGHNWIAEQLAEVNPQWDDERLYQETRKIMIALFQMWTYNEWLPQVLGSSLHEINGLAINVEGYQDDYDDSSNGGIFNEFAAAVLRFGHSGIVPHQAYLLDNHCLMDWYTVIDTFADSSMLYAYGGANLTEYVRWETWDKSMRIDRFIEDEFRVFLNQKDDLGARNIQRGRDHGVNTYNEFRTFCGLETVSFDDYIMLDHDWEATEVFKSQYNYADDIDLFAGGLSELPRGGSILGPTFTCLLIKQFKVIRQSDRFWFERPDQFTLDQLNSIKSMSLAALYCNVYQLETVQPDLMVLGNYLHENQLVNCSSLPVVDLNLWFEP